MTEKQIQNALWIWLRNRGHRWMCPNYTPRGWFECDMFSLTKTGRMIECEIKLSIADFKADVGKFRRGWGAPDERKHECLAARDTRGPTQFWFVVPDGLVTAEQVPEWAGLLHVGQSNYRNCLRFYPAKSAPPLHRKPADPRVLDHLKGIFYWRFWHARGCSAITETPEESTQDITSEA